MILHIELPDRVAGRLMDIADQRGVKVRVLIGDAIAEIIDGHPERPKPGPVPGMKRGQLNLAALDTTDPEIVEELQSLHERHWSMAEVARTMGVSYDSVRTAYQRLGLEPAQKRGRRVDIDEKRLAELQGQGVADIDIAAALGVSPAAVRRVRRNLGLPPAGIPGRRRKTTETTETKEKAA